MSERLGETYDALWGELMFVMHEPSYLWRVNEGRADWVESLGLGPGLSILDLGCGNGFLDIVLGRRGHTVIGVDQVPSVVEFAQRNVGDEPVRFMADDLREVSFDAGEFDLVLMFGVTGLMSRGDDAALFSRVNTWLNTSGSLLVDGDIELAAEESFETEHADGLIRWNWTSDPLTRTNMLNPELHRNDGSIVELRDPIDRDRGDHVGLHRYIYEPTELTETIQTAGFGVERVGHFFEFVFPDQTPGSFMLRATVLS